VSLTHLAAPLTISTRHFSSTGETSNDPVSILESYILKGPLLLGYEAGARFANETDNRELVLNTTTLIPAPIMVTLTGAPGVSVTRVKGASGGTYSSGLWSGDVPGGIDSHGSRTDDQTGTKAVTQPQRSPLPAGLAAGVAGSWIGHMILGPTNSSAQTTDADAPAAETNKTTEDFSSAGILLALLLLAAATVFYFLKIQRPSLPDFSGITGRDPSNDNLPTRRSATTRQKLSVDSVTSADKAAFQQLLIDVQKAWSKQDLTELRQFVTPEMLTYFSAALADNTSQNIQNHVDNVVLLRAEILEVWTEQARQYVTAGLRWSALDYNLSLTKQRGEPGYLVEGSEEIPTESGEAWTFMRISDGKWLLSAIQQ
jgi:inner membrane protein import complex subunit Tim44-like protein